ncbi:hypothetical protein [Streptomyces sp. NPDC049040]|uniref:hypothetical protein n=1 Tax=Streptomyces sp. NPDC049040 TaxID=3365593 RepID=UPI00371CA1B6
MENHGDAVRPTRQQALAALADAERVRAAVGARSSTPWPGWFFATLTLYVAAVPPVYGGMVARDRWGLPSGGWGALLVLMTAAFLALFRVAAARWSQETGVALRFDVLPRRAAVPVAAGLPLLMFAAPLAFRATGQPLWLYAASALGAAVSIGCHLTFVALHRRVP